MQSVPNCALNILEINEEADLAALRTDSKICHHDVPSAFRACFITTQGVLSLASSTVYQAYGRQLQPFLLHKDIPESLSP